MDFIKHECGVAMVRLLKTGSHYAERYGDLYYGLHLLERLLIREYNRGQDGAGIGCVNKVDDRSEIYRIVKEGKSAVEKISEDIENEIAFEREWGSFKHPFYGNLMLGHVRYSTTGKIGTEYLHPFLYKGKDENESVMICGNFHLINTPEISDKLKNKSIEISPDSDTKLLLYDLVTTLKEYKEHNRETLSECLAKIVPDWDGGFVICGVTGRGDWWAVRDSHGIRPAFWYADDEKVIVASEKSAIKLCAGVEDEEIHPLRPGVMIMVDAEGKLFFRRVIEEKPIRECVFERIYFSRADGGEITLEREKLGYLLSEEISEEIKEHLSNTYFSFVPASARSSFMGMVAYFSGISLPVQPFTLIGDSSTRDLPHQIVNGDKVVNFGRIIKKGAPLRTFISTEKGREELVEKTYQKVIEKLPDGIKRIVIVDDSIVRGTTLKSSVLSLLDSFNVEEIIVLSCAPQVRYPDFYGIDMSRLGELVAFKSAINLLKEKGEKYIIDEVYNQCKRSLEGLQRTKNYVRMIYSPFSEKEISKEISRLITPCNSKARIKVVFLKLEDLRKAIPGHSGDWCFSGNYPTSGAYTKICQAYVNWYEGINKR